MTGRDVAVVRTGTSNLASVMVGLERLGARPAITRSADAVRAADRVVLPGVGAFGAALAALEADGLADALRERIDAGKPTLAICLGLQLLGAGSEETPDAAGLGVVDRFARRFPDTVTRPQLGWNRIEPDASAHLLARGYAYFANTYRFVDAPPGWSAAYADHGGRFVAALERGDVLACQFHPELSGDFGRELLARWLAGGASC